MNCLRFFLWVFTISILSYQAQAQEPGAILTFAEWQKDQIQTAQISMDAAKTDLNMANNQSAPKEDTPNKAQPKSTIERGVGPNSRKLTGVPAIEARLARAKLNLEVAKGLDIHDYFILYICDQINQEAFASAISKLEPQDMAQILKSYRQYILDHKAFEGMKNSPLIVGGVSAK